MILDGVCYSDIHFGRVILYVWGSPPVFSVDWSFPGEVYFYIYEYFRLQMSLGAYLPFNATLLITILSYLSKISALPSGKGVLTDPVLIALLERWFIFKVSIAKKGRV